MFNTISINKTTPKMIAHRGLSGIEPENTAAAFIAAGNRSYFGIESDVHKTRDGKFVIIHDDNTLRTSGTNMSVEGSDYSHLKDITLLGTDSLPHPELKIPLLEDYISICARYNKTAVLELKNHFDKNDVKQIIGIINELKHLEKTIFISFDWENLVFVKHHSQNQAVQFLTGSCTESLLDDLISNRFSLDIEHTALRRGIVETLHSNGLEVNCWTVNDKDSGERLAAYGVDYITTNILE